jgi:hypothetical protein
VVAIERTASAQDADREQSAGGENTSPTGLVSAAARTGRAVLRAHWLFTVIFAAGLALRVLAEVAYRPALLYIDSIKYLVGSGGSEPEGYQVLLRLLDPLGGLALVATAQHLFGLAMAVALYTLLIRRVPRGAAAIAAAPLLLDAYQLQLEQTITPDVLFETMVAAGLVLLLWRRRPGRWLVAAGALVLGASTTVREIGAVLIVPTMIFALLTAAGLTAAGPTAAGPTAAGPTAAGPTAPGLITADWRRRTGRAALAGACFALPVLGYMTAAYGVTGHFGLARNGPAPEYGRAAAAADCATLKIPADERELCPPPALTLALGGIDGLLHNPESPGLTVSVPAGATREQLLGRFSLAVFRQQPLRVAGSMARDSVRLFALTRDGDPEITSISRWQFQAFYPTYPAGFPMAVFTRLARQHGSGDPVAVRPVATLLRDYQLHGGYTPGPVYAIGLAAGLLGALSGLPRRNTPRHNTPRRKTLCRKTLCRNTPRRNTPRRNTPRRKTLCRNTPRRGTPRPTLRAVDTELAAACLLMSLSAVVLLLGSDAFEFSWRYQLPAVLLLPAAGALGVTAIAGRLTAARTASGGRDRRTRPASAESGLRVPAAR